LRLNKIQQAAVKALEDIKATDIVPLDTRTLTSLYDAIIIATAESARQTKALARNVADEVKAAGGYVNSIEGEGSGEWVIVDCGELVVHIMLPQMRVLYHLEELWTPTPSVSSPRIRKSSEKKTTGSSSEARISGASGAIAKEATAKKPAVKPTAKRKPTAARVASKVPATRSPAAKKPAAKKPATKTPTTTRSAAKKPAAKKPATKKPVAAKPAAKKPAAKKPATKVPAAKKRGAK
jgi:ribosome-associated protein